MFFWGGPLLLFFSHWPTLSNHTEKNMWHQRWLQALIIVPLSERKVKTFMVAPVFVARHCGHEWWDQRRKNVTDRVWNLSHHLRVGSLSLPARMRWAVSVGMGCVWMNLGDTLLGVCSLIFLKFCPRVTTSVFFACKGNLRYSSATWEFASRI